MRTVGELLKEIRFTANKPDQDRFPDRMLINFLNAAQRHIQKEVFLANPENHYFDKQFEIILENNKEMYLISDYATDIWAKNSISGVLRVRSDGNASSSGITSLKKITWKERDNSYGYYVFNGHIGISPIPSSVGDNAVLVAYPARLPTLVNKVSVSELPAFCEDFLMAYVERKIQYADSSTDKGAAVFFTQEEKEQIREVFTDINGDVSYPPITDSSYINY